MPKAILCFLFLLFISQSSLFAERQPPNLKNLITEEPGTSPKAKSCDYIPGATGLTPVCVVGGRYGSCASASDCLRTRCNNQGGCTIYGTGGFCEPNNLPYSCDRLACQDMGNGYECLRGGFGGTDCSQGGQADCDADKRCHWPTGASAPKCMLGGQGTLCNIAEEDCDTAICTKNEATGENQCLLGSDTDGVSCKSPSDCPPADLRCDRYGRCSVEGTGARCSSPGFSESCAKLYCSSTNTASGVSYTCKQSGDANSSVLCPQGASAGSDCSLGDKKCGQDSITGAPTCSTEGSGASCSDPSSCKEKRCDGGLCVLGGHGKKCTNDSACSIKRCKEGPACEINDLGSGFPCQDVQECLFHHKCEEGQCNRVSGPGINTCDPNSNESTCPKYHKECVEGFTAEIQCEPVLGEGEDLCERKEDCDKLPQHKECLFAPAAQTKSCFARLGTGEHECDEDDDCRSNSSERYRYNPKSNITSNLKILSGHDGAFSIGDKNSKVTIAYFQDLTCGMCKAFYEKVFKPLKPEYIDKGKVRFVFFDYPLIPKDSDIKVVYASRCAAKEGKYTEFLDSLFASKDADPKKIASKIGVDLEKFNSCIESEDVKAALKRDQNLGYELGVSGTPSIYINGEEFSGFRSYETWKEKLKDLDN